jgi:4-amino-4-deoxy-L-arabinose transferase-like glycosyltransferase
MGATFMRRQRFLFFALGLLTLWRWALLPTLELSPDEAALALTARHGGHSEAPLLVVMVQMSTAVFGGGEFGVRFFAPVMALLASLAVWRFTRGLFDPMIAGWAVVVLNVLPAFNLAAVSMTPGTALFALTAAAMLCLRLALLHAHPLHWAWFATAACVAGAVMVAPPGIALLAGVIAALAWPNRLRHHLKAPGFIVISALWAITMVLNQGWRAFEVPALALAPNLFRWIMLASPMLITLLVLVGRLIVPNAALVGMRTMPLGFTLPMAALDLLYGPWDRWPDAGGAAWLLPAAIVLAHQGAVFGAMSSEQKISLRTIAIVCAALQSVFLMHSDLLRTLGLPWRFAGHLPPQAEWSRFFIADPSSVMRGWRESAGLFDSALEKAPKSFSMASNAQMAAELEFYSKSGSRFVDLAGLQKGCDVLFITDDPAAVKPAPELEARFAYWELLSVARVMHAGNEVRWLKIFSCSDFRPPES